VERHGKAPGPLARARRVIPRVFPWRGGTTAGSLGDAAPARDRSREPEPAAHRNHLFSLFPATAPRTGGASDPWTTCTSPRTGGGSAPPQNRVRGWKAHPGRPPPPSASSVSVSRFACGRQAFSLRPFRVGVRVVQRADAPLSRWWPWQQNRKKVVAVRG
jgi:hypothetical protein